MQTAELVVLDVVLIPVGGLGGMGLAWWLRRRTVISGRNLYLLALAACLLLAGAVAVRWWPGVVVLVPVVAVFVGGSSAAWRWRAADLGAGAELREHELARRWMWQSGPERAPRERVYLRGQGELVHERPWPPPLEYVSMTHRGDAGPRLALGAGRHVLVLGATGAGKTTTARRLIAARALSQRTGLLVLDQKGDEEDVAHMRLLAAHAKVPFILFDSQDPDTDRWQPLWGTPDGVAARCVEPIRASEPYYYDTLRRHLDIVCKVLAAADKWPPSVPLLVDCCQPFRYASVVAIAKGLEGKHARLARRAVEHGAYVNSPQGIKDLTGGANRLEVALALAGRQLVTPRMTPDGDAVAVRLVEALQARAVVMWRTHADTMPDEAAALTVLALADLHDAAERARAQWTLLLDEFGAVIEMAAQRGLAILQRGRSHGGQVIVITQSAADVEAITGKPGLLASLTDNFAGIVSHRQTAPESRDWLAKLMGTRGLWQSTNATASHGTQHSGRGSARRVREFWIGADEFSTLGRGQAVIYTPGIGEPTIGDIMPLQLADAPAARIDQAGPRDRSEVSVHPEERLPEVKREPAPATAGDPGASASPPVAEIDPVDGL